MEKISNGEISVEVSPVGAEMQSLRDLQAGKELLWQGDARYWGRRSPILFPVVGGLWNGTYRAGDAVLHMPKHGFVRDVTWQVAGRADGEVTFAHEWTAEEGAAFPWPYRVEVGYALRGREVVVTFRVANVGREALFFQMGGHPGFALPDFREDRPVSGYLRLEGEVSGLLRVGEQGCTVPLRHPVPADEAGRVPVCRATFEHEALIFDGGQVGAATLLRCDGTPLVRVESTAPAWLFWAPQGVHAPFVCMEPWYGLCDAVGYEGEVGGRPYINRLEPGATWQGGYTIRVC